MKEFWIIHSSHEIRGGTLLAWPKCAFWTPKYLTARQFPVIPDLMPKEWSRKVRPRLTLGQHSAWKSPSTNPWRCDRNGLLPAEEKQHSWVVLQLWIWCWFIFHYYQLFSFLIMHHIQVWWQCFLDLIDSTLITRRPTYSLLSVATWHQESLEN